ncbi:MAG: M67 family metallopeptidase [Methanobacteriota archaeon]|nr:MAG: M67 family metallopeptidase [Euryarchaeota archaeon]
MKEEPERDREASRPGDATSVQITKSVVEAIKRHGRETYPDEGCGFLLGPDATPRRIDEFRAARNIEAEDRDMRYRVDPAETLGLTKELSGSGREILGFYHSHPDHPARPSVTDLDRGFTWYTYVIVAVEKGRPVDLRAWSLDDRDGRRTFREVEIELV